MYAVTKVAVRRRCGIVLNYFGHLLILAVKVSALNVRVYTVTNSSDGRHDLKLIDDDMVAA